MRIPRNIGRKIHRLHQKIHRAGALNSEKVLLRWTQLTIPTGHNPHIETSPQPTAAEQKQEVFCFVHYVNIHTTGYTRFTEIKTGDVILDFIGDVAIDGKEGLEFEIGRVGNTPGKLYVQKNGGKELAESWDVHANNQAVTRTVLVTLKS